MGQPGLAGQLLQLDPVGLAGRPDPDRLYYLFHPVDLVGRLHPVGQSLPLNQPDPEALVGQWHLSTLLGPVGRQLPLHLADPVDQSIQWGREIGRAHV